MVAIATLTTLAAVEQEMKQAGRVQEERALREALTALAQPGRDILTTGQAAARLGVSIPTVKRGAERGALAGYRIGNRWRISAESVDHLVRLRNSLMALEEEG